MNRQRETSQRQMTTSQPTVSLEHVTKKFGEFTAVNDLSLAVRAGRIYGLIGPNGAGKTTTIRMIVNITAPDSGAIHLFGRQMNAESQDRIGYLPEERGLYKKMKVGEQLLYLAQLKGLSKKDALARIKVWLEKFEIGEEVKIRGEEGVISKVYICNKTSKQNKCVEAGA